MAANQITPNGLSAIDCTIINGEAAPPGHNVLFWDVPGFNNKGVQIVGKKSPTGFSFQLYKHGARAAVIAWRNSIIQLTGKKCTIENSGGESFANCIIASPVEIEQPVRACASAESGVDSFCVLRIRGQRFVS